MKKKYSPSNIMGIDLGLGFLANKKLEVLGVEVMWNVVNNLNIIAPYVTQITEITSKINATYWDNEAKTPKKGMEADFDLALKELNNRTFLLDLKPIPSDKITGIEGLTGIHLLQLHPILTQ
jgi:hypothetical protein